MYGTNPKVDAYLSKPSPWTSEIEKLRTIILDFPLSEELKWYKPCYMFQKSNVLVIIPMKESCALMFAKGVLLADANGVLDRPGENSQSGRWIKFTSVQQIVEMEDLVKAYIGEAIELEMTGRKVVYKDISEFTIPGELQARLDEDPALKTAFHALTPGRQRGYFMHFSAPKQAKTREARVEKCIPQILEGKGLNDR